ncbi:MAG TPA: flagellar hook-associated protein FlgK [Beijerinckiaceae bacterium]|nr:flagellar hook-associated protein FlgK [Beijerinckiaceae bacterium]
MSLLSALNAATSGLRVTQAGIGVVSQNVANADTAGYTRRRLAPIQQLAGERTSGVRAGDIERVIDLVAQRQLRLETSGAAYTALNARFAADIDRLFGQPGSSSSLDSTVNAFAGALQTLASDPSSFSARSGVLDAAGSLASRIGAIANGIQGLRSDAENRIGAAVGRANELLAGIASLNAKVVTSGAPPAAALLDERDRLVNELSGLMDVQVAPGQGGSVTLMTSSGLMLFDGSSAVKLGFDGRDMLAANALYSSDPAQRGVGTITATTIQGASVDAVASGMFRSGEIAAALDMRDRILPQAQRQLDELAAGLSRALSDREVAGVAASSPPQNGFAIDLAGLQAGNAVTLDYTANGTARRVILMPTTGGAPGTISAADTADPNATIIRVNISGGLTAASVFTDINAALAASGIALTADSPAANTWRFLDDGLANTTDVTGVSAGITVTTLASGFPQLPLFVDAGYGNTAFTGSFEGGSHLTGFAQRMALNPAVLADRSKLVVYSTAPPTPQGDTVRAQFLFDSLTKAGRTFGGATGIAGADAPFSATAAEFARRIVEAQGANAETAERFDQGQQVALAAIQSRFADYSGVNIDQEMAMLVQLQTAYGANARIMTAVRDMLDMLMRI